MYESPIRIIQKQFEKSVENEIFKAVFNVGVDVDKEELIRALQYDRDQYEKGFKDGELFALEIKLEEKNPEELELLMGDFIKESSESQKTQTETQETRKSKWEIDCDGYYPYCPNCGEEPPSGKMTNFCPNCGKDMRGDK